MAYTSKRHTVKTLLETANAAGLEAAAGVLKGAVQDGLRGGFTSGDFDTGDSVEGVKVTAVQESADGMSIRVGTDLVKSLVWELGHLNVYTRKFERKEVWLPASQASAGEQLAAFTAAHKRVMGG
jgi:hypothetical protein